MKTTAIYPNRVAQKYMVEHKFGLNEFGDNDIKFYSWKNKYHIATGYIRIVYGDHGPYVEFNKGQIRWDEFEAIREDIGYYDIWKSYDKVKIYVQRYTVHKIPNPPKGKYSFNNNCQEGYADYKIGMVYISIDHIALDSKPLLQQGLMF